MTKVLAFAIHQTADWWKYLLGSLNFADGIVVSDIRGDGDFNIVGDFYATARKGGSETALSTYGTEGCADIIRRCRVLRNLPYLQALSMIGGMHCAISQVFDRVRPTLSLSLTIDRYTTDIFARIAESRGIEHLEMTVSIIPDQIIFLKRGKLQHLWDPTDKEVDIRVRQVHSPNFIPAEVNRAKSFSIVKYFQTISYFRARGYYFNAKRFLTNDPWNLHYLDAQPFLDHKARWSDVSVLNLLDKQWRTTLEPIEIDKRVFLALQLFPEASMDYWLESLDMLDHDAVILQYCDVLGDAGYQVFVKDHPLQFGFRRRELINELARRDHVTLIPYEVPAQVLISLCDISVTLTGTVGFQAALAGLCSVVTDPYYATEDDYVHIRKRSEIGAVVDRIASFSRAENTDMRRRNLLRKLSGGSVPGDYFTFREFDPENPEKQKATQSLIDSLNTYLPKVIQTSCMRMSAP
jgi:hypothetical protein